MDERVASGSWVVAYFNERRRYLVRAGSGAFNTNEGVIDLEELVGACYGERWKTHLGIDFILVRPSILDLLEAFERKTQVIYPKDSGYIVLLAGIGPGSRVVEAGTGSGYMTAVLAHAVGPSGKVYTYEIRRDLQDIAVKNLRKIGLEERVVFKHGDVRRDVEERSVDAAVLDIPDPWNAAANVLRSLRPGGRIVCFLPTINQLERTFLALTNKGFIMVEARELIERKYKVKRGETRPETLTIGHTGYIVSATRP